MQTVGAATEKARDETEVGAYGWAAERQNHKMHRSSDYALHIVLLWSGDTHAIEHRIPKVVF